MGRATLLPVPGVGSGLGPFPRPRSCAVAPQLGLVRRRTVPPTAIGRTRGPPRRRAPVRPPPDTVRVIVPREPTARGTDPVGREKGRRADRAAPRPRPPIAPSATIMAAQVEGLTSSGPMPWPEAVPVSSVVTLPMAPARRVRRPHKAPPRGPSVVPTRPPAVRTRRPGFAAPVNTRLLKVPASGVTDPRRTEEVAGRIGAGVGSGPAHLRRTATGGVRAGPLRVAPVAVRRRRPAPRLIVPAPHVALALRWPRRPILSRRPVFLLLTPANPRT